MSYLFDLQDATIGKLTVKERKENYASGDAKWLCACECGNTRIVKGSYLKKKVITACLKCSNRYEDFTGRVIGKLTVLRRTDDKINSKGVPIIQWECQCECGEKVTRVSGLLRRGNCSCSKCKVAHDKIANFRGCGEISGVFWSSVKTNAKRRRREFSITKEYAWELILQQNRKCALSNITLMFATDKKGQLRGEGTASLDRIDSKQGYIVGNVQWIHKWINLMKNDFTTEELVSYCKKIVKHHKKKTQTTFTVRERIAPRLLTSVPKASVAY